MVNEFKKFMFRAFADHANDPAVITHDRRLSFRRLEQIITMTSEKLRSLHIQKDEPVALLFENSPEYIILLQALWKLGAIAVPVSNRWPGELVHKSLLSIPCHKIIASEKTILPAENKFKIFYPSQLVSPDHDVNGVDAAIFSFDPDRAATIIFTSGSTREPKAVLHSFGNFYYNALGSFKNIPFTAGDRWLLTLPLYHVGGLSIVFRSLINGGTVVMPDEHRSMPENIYFNRITHISLVPTQLYRLLQEKSSVEKSRSLKAILLGGGAVPGQLVEKAFELNLPIHTSYGSTEMASQITTTRPGDPLDRLQTGGQILPYRKLKIAPDHEIRVKGRTLFTGYIQDNKITRPVDKDGWFATGDLGRMDEKGCLTVMGRKDNMFISGGENIQPEEIENQLNNIPGIEQSLVVPVDNAEFGQRPVAFIKDKSAPADILNIKRQLQKFLPKFKIPDHFFPWPEEKRSGIKPDRKYFVQLAKDLILSTGRS